MGVSQNKGYHFGAHHSKDYSILGSILGSPYSGKLPYNPILVVSMFFPLSPITGFWVKVRSFGARMGLFNQALAEKLGCIFKLGCRA